MNGILQNLGFILKMRGGEERGDMGRRRESREGKVIFVYREVLSTGGCRGQVEGESQTGRDQ